MKTEQICWLLGAFFWFILSIFTKESQLFYKISFELFALTSIILARLAKINEDIK